MVTRAPIKAERRQIFNQIINDSDFYLFFIYWTAETLTYIVVVIWLDRDWILILSKPEQVDALT